MDWKSWNERQERNRRHEAVLDNQRRQHEEQLAALRAKSAREAELDGQKATVDVVLRDLQDRAANLDGHYQAKSAALEASFNDRLSQAIDARKSEVDEHKARARRVLEGWADRVYEKAMDAYERKQRLAVAYDVVCDAIDRHRRLRGLPEIDSPAQRRERLARIDEAVGKDGSGLREQVDEILTGQLDAKESHRQEVERAVTDAVEGLKH